ncbi:MAG: DUF4743 domain-containing protein [Rhodospirillales bacterium]|nr:DUF4743 domain-containing protein [Rhodospirillales bacterium]
MSLIERLDACARFTPGNYRPLVISEKMLGRVDHAFAETLSAFDDVFEVTPDAVALSGTLADPAERTDAVARVLEKLRDDGLFPGWRGEHYPVSESFYAAPLLTVERATVPRFGTMGYGVHLNGYVMKGETIHMWVGRRSMKKPTGPGKLDQVVAGGQPVGLSVWDNLMKECGEEAGMPADLARHAHPVGTVSYITERDEGLRHDVLFNYDLELPDSFKPTPTDGEVDEFYLWPIEDVVVRIRDTDDFKFNAALVIIDFAVRHGVLVPDDPEYIDITEAIRVGRFSSAKVR